MLVFKLIHVSKRGYWAVDASRGHKYKGVIALHMKYVN